MPIYEITSLNILKLLFINCSLQNCFCIYNYQIHFKIFSPNLHDYGLPSNNKPINYLALSFFIIF